MVDENVTVTKEIKNVWVGVGRNSMINRVLFLSADDSVKKAIKTSTFEEYKKFNSTKTDVQEWNREALILEEQYFHDIKNINEDHNLYNFKETVFAEDALSPTNKVISLKRIRNETLDKYDTIKFLIIQYDEELLFLSVNSRKTIKEVSMLNIYSKLKNIGVGSTVIEMNSGIQIPEMVTAVFEISNNRLYVLDVLGFERMLYINEISKRKAETNFKKFVTGDYTISSDNWTVEFDNSKKIKEEILKSTRAINRISNYENDSTYNVSQIKGAVNQLKDEESKVIFDNKNKKVQVNSCNYKTFIGIIHNGIVKRLISGDVEVLM